MSKKILDEALSQRVPYQIQEGIKDFIIKDNLSFYGNFLLNVNFYKTEKIGTAGVNFKQLRMNFYYNPKFLDKLNQKQIKYLMIHELFHLLFSHPKRGQGYYHPLANIAMDMIINEIIDNKHNDISERCTPDLVVMDSHYTGDRIFEVLYLWLNNKYEEWKEKHSQGLKQNILDNSQKGESQQSQGDGGDSDGSGEGEEGGNGGSKESDDKKEGNGKKKKDINEPENEQRKKENEEMGIDERTRTFFEQVYTTGACDGTDEHFWDDVPDEVRKSIIQKHMDSLRSRGLISGSDDDIINKLIKSPNNFLRLLKKNMNIMKGFIKNPSIRRPNRRNISGLKGKIKYARVFNCLMDTSGSMYGSFDKVISEIFQDDFQINLVQCDAEVQKYERISKKSQLQKLAISGLGGTILQPGIDFITNSRDINKNNMVILTDGYTDVFDFSRCQNVDVLIISCGVACQFSGSNRVKQVIIPEKKS